MKIAVITDTHFGADNLRWSVGAMAACREWCGTNKIKHAFHLGDFWKHRSPIPVPVLDAVGRELSCWRAVGINLHVVVGNHDQADREGGVHGLRVLGEPIQVYSEPHIADLGGWRVAVMPYRAPHALPEALGLLAGKSVGAADYLVGHFGVRGALMNDRVRDADGVDAGALKGWKRVLLGHYHKPHNVGRTIVYVGSPIQHDFGEEGQVKGWACFDLAENRIDYVPYDAAPRHHTIEWDGTGAAPSLPAGVREHDRVRLRIRGDGAAIASPGVRAAVAAMGVAGHAVQVEAEPVIADKSRIAVTATTPLAEMVRRYVEAAATADLDRERLVVLGTTMLEGS